LAAYLKRENWPDGSIAIKDGLERQSADKIEGIDGDGGERIEVMSAIPSHYNSRPAVGGQAQPEWQ
jgi:hypothetical protein